MRFENTEVWGFEHALRGMRNPKNSWKQSDSWVMPIDDPNFDSHCGYWIGPKDMKLALALINGGPEHRKFLRQIFVSVDITAPLYLWKELDTYKVATVANSTSTMHKIMSTPITRESFEMDDYESGLKIPITQKYANMFDGMFFEHDNMIDTIINYMETLRQEYLRIQNEIKSSTENTEELQKRATWVWKELIRWLPESWLQKRTITFNYETIRAICSPGQRRFHKLNEWSGKNNSNVENFISWARQLPYAQEFIFTDELIKPKPKTQDELLKELCSYLCENHEESLSLEDFGVSIFDENGTMKSIHTVFEELATKFDKTQKI